MTIGKIPLVLSDGSQIQVPPALVICNGVTFPWEYNPRNTSLWVIQSPVGVLGALWADDANDALDRLVNEGLGNSLIMADKEATPNTPRVGNADEPANLDGVTITRVVFNLERDAKLLCLFAEARGDGSIDNLSELE